MAMIPNQKQYDLAKTKATWFAKYNPAPGLIVLSRKYLKLGKKMPLAEFNKMAERMDNFRFIK